MRKLNRTSDTTSAVAQKRTRFPIIIATCAILIALSGSAWYLHAASRYQEEQSAIRELESMLGGRGVRVVVGQTAPDAAEHPDDVALEIRMAWVSADWLRGPIEVLGAPVFQRVEIVSIYDATIGDSLIEPLTKFLEMKELKIAPESEISRDGLRQLKTAVPKAIVWFAHGEEGFDSPSEEEHADADYEQGPQPTDNAKE